MIKLNMKHKRSIAYNGIPLGDVSKKYAKCFRLKTVCKAQNQL